MILSGGTSKCVPKIEIVKSSVKLGSRKEYPQQRGSESRFMVHKKSLQWGNRFVCLLWSAGLETEDKILAGIRSWAQQVIITASWNDFGQEGETHRQSGSPREDKGEKKKRLQAKKSVVFFVFSSWGVEATETPGGIIVHWNSSRLDDGCKKAAILQWPEGSSKAKNKEC